MKKTRKNNNDTDERRTEQKVRPHKDGTVVLYHRQSIRQSMNYNSAEAVYGVELIVADNDEAIQKGFARAEELIEEPMVDKFEMQRETLKKL